MHSQESRPCSDCRLLSQQLLAQVAWLWPVGMVQLILASRNRPDFSVTVNRSNRFAYCSTINSDCSSYFESWDLNLIDENPVPPNSESILQQELCDLQPFRMSLKENLDSLPHQRSRYWPFVLKNLKGVVLRTHQRYWN